MRRILKRLTIQKRAHALGCKIKDEFGFAFTGNPEQNNACRTLIRLQRIRCGMKPFAYSTGHHKDVYVSDYALKSFGNL